MAKIPGNHRKEWTAADVRQLKHLVKANTPTRVIALKLQRTEAASYQQAHRHDISLSPWNQRPYDRGKS